MRRHIHGSHEEVGNAAAHISEDAIRNGKHVGVWKTVYSLLQSNSWSKRTNCKLTVVYDIVLKISILDSAPHCLENFKHTLKCAWVAVRAKATKSESVEAYAFLREQHKLAKLNQIKSRYPLLLIG